jgi:hypothetical protein
MAHMPGFTKFVNGWRTSRGVPSDRVSGPPRFGLPPLKEHRFPPVRAAPAVKDHGLAHQGTVGTRQHLRNRTYQDTEGLSRSQSML